MRHVCGLVAGAGPIQQAGNKKELIQQLSVFPDAVVVLDYTLFDLSGVEELLILQERFKPADWVLFSEDLSVDFMRHVSFSDSFSIVLKDCLLDEIVTSIRRSLQSERYICQRVSSLLATKKNIDILDNPILTNTEWEILKLIALGKTTKEIAEERFSSTHTITTHRKNIFRKLDVNNVHEATKYALRAGIVDLAEYYI
ncbi:helix-turn-helix transcriptional regulator [Bacteroidia bacterium]|nr:helix-turn-helix transcriptional regulator [Bacteroidia bacterium]